MKVKIDFQLNRRFGIVERLIFRLVLNGFSNAREIGLALPIFSDAVMANAARHLVNEQIISADVETGTLSLSEAMVAIIAMCQKQSFEIDVPESLEGDVIRISDNSIPEAVELKCAIIQALLPEVRLDLYRYSLDFIIFPARGASNE